MSPLRFTTCQAPLAEFFAQAVAEYAGERLGLPIQFINDIDWRERARRFDDGDIQVCWLCGAPYVWRADQPEPHMELLAAPVMAAPRYQGRPVYFSDVVVRRDSGFRAFADLRGAIWSINERTSHSGYYVTRYHLAARGETGPFFGRVVEAGAHQTSLQMILDGRIDASAIDSTVLELLYERDPDLPAQIRIIDTLGPSPIPPWVIAKTVAPELCAALRATLTQMHTDPHGQAILARGQAARFAAVTDHDYDEIRRMLQVGERVML